MALTPRQELFARGVAAGNTQVGALRNAYPGTRGWAPRHQWTRASVLMADAKVLQRVDELKEQVSEKVVLTAEKVLRDIERVREMAVESGDYNPALKASELQGKYLKMWTDKVDVGGQEDNPVVFNLNFVSASDRSG